MASEPCSRCGERVRGKTASLYTSWYPDRDHRVSYLSRLCAPCAADLLVPIASRPIEDVSQCIQCGGNLEEPTASTFLTAYIPGKEQWDDRQDTCVACAMFLRERLTLGGKLQPDRGVGVRGPSPSQAVWDAIPV